MFLLGSCEARINELLLSNIDLERFRKLSRNSGLVPEMRKPRIQLNGEMLDKITEDNKVLIRLFDEYSQSIVGVFDYSYLMMLTDVNGAILGIVGPPSASACGIAVGTSLAVHSVGINAVSAAILLNRAVYMAQEEHYLHIFKDWACICVPVRDQTGATVGYMDFSTSPDLELSVYYPIVCLMVTTLEFEMKRQTVCLVDLENKLLRSKLTPRQREVVTLWISGDDYKSIANKLCISDKTVRTVIAEIYRRLNVHSKSEMISMFCAIQSRGYNIFSY